MGVSRETVVNEEPVVTQSLTTGQSEESSDAIIRAAMKAMKAGKTDAEEADEAPVSSGDEDAEIAEEAGEEKPSKKVVKTEKAETAETAPEEPGAPETTPEAPAEPPKDSKAMAWAVIKEQEKKNREMRDALRRQQVELNTQLESIKTQAAQSAALLQDLKKDPLGFLAKQGITYEHLTERVLNDGKLGPQELSAQSSSEAASLRQELAEVKNMLRQQSIERGLSAYRSSLEAALKKPEFALLATRKDAAEQMYTLATQYAQQSNQVLQPDEVASILQDTWKEELKQLGSHKAIRQALGLLEETEEEDASNLYGSDDEESRPAKSKAAPKKLKALTNATGMAPRKVVPVDDDESEATERDIIKRAAKLVPDDIWNHIDR